MNLMQFSVDVIGPVVILLAAGKLLHARGKLSDDFIANGSSLVFNFALPALLFISISQANFEQAANVELISIGLLITLMFFALSAVIVQLVFPCRADRGVIVQGSFRANLGVVGLAYAANAFGTEDFAQASVFMGALVLLYNILSVWVLNLYLPKRMNTWQTFTSLLSNPIMLAIIAALVFTYNDWQLPQIVNTSTQYFAQLTLPLALLCTGAAIRFRGMRGQLNALIFTIVCKCLLYPLAMVGAGIYWDLGETELLTMLFMSIAPTAAVSFIMVKKMGGNADLAANIVAITTIVSIPVTLVGYGWVINVL